LKLKIDHSESGSEARKAYPEYGTVLILANTVALEIGIRLAHAVRRTVAGTRVALTAM
jgi:hypothetical protein